MRLKRKDREKIRRCVEDGIFYLGYLEHHVFLKETEAQELDELLRLFIKIGAIIDRRKDGKRRPKRSVEKASWRVFPDTD